MVKLKVPTMEQNEEMMQDVQVIENSPFVCVRQGTGYFVAMGRHRVTDEHGSAADAVKEVEDNPWDIVLRMVSVIAPMAVEDELQKRESKQGGE